MYNNTQYLSATWAALKANTLLKKQLFLSADDADTLRFFTSLSRQGWRVSYLDIPRVTNMTSYKYMDSVGHASAVLNYLLGLDLAVACDAFVGPLNSNIARLIDELRSTSRCKAEAVFEDPEQGPRYETHGKSHW